MPEYRLHCFPESGNSYKVALMLAVCGADWEPVFVDFFHGQTREGNWREAHNVMGEAPVLEHSGRSLTQSGAILHYLAGKLGRFGGESEQERQEVLRWILFDNHKFTSYFATHRFLRSIAPAAPDPAVLAFFKGRADNAMEIAEKHLAERQFVAADGPTIADISMAGYLYYPQEETGYDFARDYPAIAAWLDRIKALDGWQGPYELMPGKRAERRA